MESKFIVKVQKIGEVQTKSAEVPSFASPIVIEPVDTVNVRRGSLYAVIDVRSSNTFDPSLVLKIISDEMQTLYFANIEGTPMQALEKAVSVIREKIITLLVDSGKIQSIKPASPEFQAVLSVIWGNVLYVVQVGKGCSYLVRDGRIKSVNTMSEGDFSIASGAVKDGDIVILGSENFCKSNSPESLLKGSSSFANNVDTAAIILKFHIEKGSQAPTALNLKSVSGLKIRKAGRFNFKKISKGLVILALFGVLGFAVYSAFTSGQLSIKNNELATAKDLGRQKIDEAVKLIGVDDARARQLLSEANTHLTGVNTKFNAEELLVLIKESAEKLDEVNKIRKDKTELVLDLRAENKDINPSELVSTDSKNLLVSDFTGGKLYNLTYEPSIVLKPVESTSSASPRFLSMVDAGAAFLGKDDYYLYDSGNQTVSGFEDIDPKFPISEVKALSSYIGNIYLIHDGEIFKNNISWASKDADLNSAVSMAIDGDIYVLTSGGEVFKYTSGVKALLPIKSLDVPLKEPKQVVSEVNFLNLYFLDAGLRRVVVTDKNGELKGQYVIDTSLFPDELRALAVSRDEKAAFVLSGTKVVKISLN